MIQIFTDKIWIDGWAFYLIVVGCLWGGCLWGWYARKQHEKTNERRK